MPGPLHYSSLPPEPRRPRWTGTIILAAVLGGGLSLLLAAGYHSQGLYSEERTSVFVVVLASAICIVAGGIRLRRDPISSGTVAQVACIVGLGVAVVLN